MEYYDVIFTLFIGIVSGTLTFVLCYYETFSNRNKDENNKPKHKVSKTAEKKAEELSVKDDNGMVKRSLIGEDTSVSNPSRVHGAEQR